MKRLRYALIAILSAYLLSGCGGNDASGQVLAPSVVDLITAPAQVLLMTNPAGPNMIREYRRDAAGALTFVADYPTGGTGSGDNLNGSSNSIFLDRINGILYAVNAGNNTVSAMRLNTDGSLTQLSTVASGGTRPISVTAAGNLVYVLNFGNPAGPVAANISGFRFNGTQLVPIATSTQALSAANPNPAQIGFSTSGTILVVTERATNMISTFTLGPNGAANTVNPQGSAGPTPFGFDFTPRGLLVVSQANGGAVNGSSTSTYSVNAAGIITPVSPNVANNQTGNCWVKSSANGNFAFTTNTASNTVTGYQILQSGGLNLLGGGASGNTGNGPIDLGIANDGRFLYTLNGTADSISTFSIANDASLTAQPASGITGLPPNTVGMVVR